MDNYLDIVNEDDVVIGKELRSIIHQKGLRHREVHVYLFNSQGQVILQQRSLTKETYPGLLDVSVGGHVELGEEYEEAAIREMFEEAGITAQKDDLHLLNKISHFSQDIITNKINNVIRSIYVYPFFSDLQNLKVDPADVIGFEAVTINQLLNEDEKIKARTIPGMFDTTYKKIHIELRSYIEKYITLHK